MEIKEKIRDHAVLISSLEFLDQKLCYYSTKMYYVELPKVKTDD